MFYIIEHDIRPDGTVNTSEVGRTTKAMAKSYYFERYSKMLVNETFKRVALMLTDENLTVLEHEVVFTQYKEPVDEIELGDEEMVGEPSVS